MSAIRTIGLGLSLLLYVPVKLLWAVFIILFRAYCELSRFSTSGGGPVTWYGLDVSVRFHDGWWNG